MLKMNSVKKIYLLFGSAIAAIILHNVIYGFFKIEEPVFFTLGLGLAFGFFASVFYYTFTYLKRKEPADLWKLGWIGLFGLLGLIPGFNVGLFGFFGFFGYFGMKK